MRAQASFFLSLSLSAGCAGAAPRPLSRARAAVPHRRGRMPSGRSGSATASDLTTEQKGFMTAFVRAFVVKRPVQLSKAELDELGQDEKLCWADMKVCPHSGPRVTHCASRLHRLSRRRCRLITSGPSSGHPPLSTESRCSSFSAASQGRCPTRRPKTAATASGAPRCACTCCLCTLSDAQPRTVPRPV